MTPHLHWETKGKGLDLVLIHGWGMNGAVWKPIVEELSQTYCVHTVDLLGYGYSQDYDFIGHDENYFNLMVKLLLAQAPEKAIWLGWSLGGLLATQIALCAPERVSHLITVASTPRFSAISKISADDSLEAWLGISSNVLNRFIQQLNDNFMLTVERFIALQALGSVNAKEDIRQIKEAVFSRPIPNQEYLALGLDILANMDLRARFSDLSMPVCRMYGKLDGLVPIGVVPSIDELLPNSKKVIFEKASHAPFISHRYEFIKAVRIFLKQ